MQPMLRKIQNYIQSHNLLQAEKANVIVGFSGGSDSVALLDILLKLGYTCIAAHCNFHLRSEESNRDQAFAEAHCKDLQIPFYHIDLDTQAYAKEKQISIEMAARELRYNWFEELRKKHHAQAIATGHHLDDDVETVILNLLRGTGLKGLTGIPAKNAYVVRPLLTCSKEEIMHYLQEQNLNYVTDSTNLETDYVRNKIRHQIIPILKEINPSFEKSMAASLSVLNETYQIFQDSIQTVHNKLISKNDDTTTIDIKKLKEENYSTTILYELLREFNFNPEQVKQIVQALNASSGKQFNSHSHKLLKDRNTLIIKAIEKNSGIASGNYQVITINHHSDLLQVEVFEKEANFKFSTVNNLVHLDADKLQFPLQLRTWIEGDYFYPLGMQGKKKLSDFLIDEKINLFEKQTIQVLLSDNEIVWVVGYRIDDRFKMTDKTKNIAAIQLK